MTQRSSRHRLTLRPRAGLAATALLIAGLAGSGAAAYVGDFIEPASAKTEDFRIDRHPAVTDVSKTDPVQRDR